ncbi:MAG TPA: hypothetical protein VMS38_01260, partial [Pseudorhodoferax sp.]|nr:hypothetical protein [Pseudorhodoferax sp.]
RRAGEPAIMPTDKATTRIWVTLMPDKGAAVTRPGTPDFDLLAACIAVESGAARRCGLSDLLYESHVQDAYELILDSVPDDARAATEAVLRERGFDPERVPYEAGDGQCSVTGINERCCPCGRHL